MQEQEAEPNIPPTPVPGSHELGNGHSGSDTPPPAARIEERPLAHVDTSPSDNSAREKPGLSAITFMFLLALATFALVSSAFSASRLTTVAILFLMGAVVVFGQCCIDLWPWKSPTRKAHWSAGYRVLALLLVAGGILVKGEKWLLP